MSCTPFFCHIHQREEDAYSIRSMLSDGSFMEYYTELKNWLRKNDLLDETDYFRANGCHFFDLETYNTHECFDHEYYTEFQLAEMTRHLFPVGTKVFVHGYGWCTISEYYNYRSQYAIVTSPTRTRREVNLCRVLDTHLYLGSSKVNLDELPTCPSCGYPVFPCDSTELDGRTYHEDCIFYCSYHDRNEELRKLAYRGIETLNGDIISVCCDCPVEYCPASDAYHLASEFTEVEGLCVWQGATDQIAHCEDCGTTIFHYHRGLCDACRERRQLFSGINSYGVKPVPTFFGNPKSSIINGYLGIELEVDKGGEDDEYASEVNDMLGYTYCKHDGSLDEGFEIVTFPGTLEYHMEAKSKWEEASRFLFDRDYRSHDARTCGLHVHVSRDAFGETPEEQEAAIARLVYLFERHWDNFVTFSRRTKGQLREWANKYGRDDGETIKDLYDKAKGSYSRYKAINLCNKDTIEFRMWRGTLNIDTFMATLQLVALLVKASTKSTKSVVATSWKGLVKSDYPELNAYLESRGLK